MSKDYQSQKNLELTDLLIDLYSELAEDIHEHTVLAQVKAEDWDDPDFIKATATFSNTVKAIEAHDGKDSYVPAVTRLEEE